MIEGIAALIAAFATAILGYAAALAMGKALRRQRTRYTEDRVRRQDAVLFLTPSQRILLNLASGLAFGVLGTLILGLAAGVILSVVGLFAPGLYIRQAAERRLELFNEQLVDALHAMSAAFRAGLSFPQALESVAEESDPPLSHEFRIVVRELRVGREIPDALANAAQRTGSEDMGLVATTTAVAQGLGGNMAEMLESIARTTEARFRIEGKIRALTAQGKLQGWVVACMPLILGLIFNWMRPDLMGPMMSHPFGWALVAGIIALEIGGIYLIRRIVAIEY
ncbi:MAG: type II secretion system F family protein [Myxococcota bacterium]|nr:type II secretion system F family protein [Myxococcota bacterium]